MTYRLRRMLSVLVLLVALPIYVVVVISVMAWFVAWFGRPPFIIELIIYVVLGVIWAFPLKSVFTTIRDARIEIKQKYYESRKH